jgi:hypothetical protein
VGVDEHEAAALTRLPGLALATGASVTRLLEQPVVVHAALVTGRGWRPLLRRAPAFDGVCQRVVLLDAEPRDLASRLWEADMLGCGVWCRMADGVVREVVAPEVFVPSYFKPARWRFQENAYAAYLDHEAARKSDAGVSARRPPG